MTKQKFTITLGIAVNPTNSEFYHLTCQPAVLRVSLDDDIEFHAGGLPFAIVAKGSSALDKTYIQSAGDPETATVKVSNGVYSFACAVFDTRSGKIYMDANCPQLPVDPFRG